MWVAFLDLLKILCLSWDAFDVNRAMLLASTCRYGQSRFTAGVATLFA